jgi:hypothetical protein
VQVSCIWVVHQHDMLMDAFMQEARPTVRKSHADTGLTSNYPGLLSCCTSVNTAQLDKAP